MQSLTVKRSHANQLILFLLLTCVAVGVSSAAWYIWKLEAKWAIFSFLALLFPFVLSMIKDLRRFLVWMMVFLLPLGIDYKFFYQRTHAGQPGFSLGTTEIILIILLVHWIVSSVRQKMTRKIKLYPAITLPTLALIAMHFVSMLAAKNPLLTLFDAIVYVKMLIFFLYLANNLHDQEDMSTITSALFFGLIIQSIFMMLQYYKGSPLGLVGTEELQNFMAFRREGVYVSRPGGTIGNVNGFARYLGFVLPMASIFMLTSNDRKNLPLAFIASIGGLVALIISQTRSVWGPFIVCMVFALIYIFTRNLLSMRVIKRILLGLVLFSVVLVVYRDVVYNRLTADDHGSAKARVTTAKVALDIISDHPIIGIGANNYDYYIRSYWVIEDVFTKIAIVHNYYLLMIAQLGIIGFGSFLWLLIALFIRMRTAMRSRVKYYRQIAVGIMASFICFLLAALADGYQGLILLYLFWGQAAMIEAINGREDDYDDQIVEMISEKRYLNEL